MVLRSGHHPCWGRPLKGFQPYMGFLRNVYTALVTTTLAIASVLNAPRINHPKQYTPLRQQTHHTFPLRTEVIPVKTP